MASLHLPTLRVTILLEFNWFTHYITCKLIIHIPVLFQYSTLILVVALVLVQG